MAQWTSHHTPDNAFAKNAVWDPDPNLPSINGHVGAHYTTVDFSSGRALNYQENFAGQTSISEARALASAEFPTDVTSLWFQVKDTCAQEEFSSAILGQALGGASQEQVFAEYETVDSSGNGSYDGSNITDVFFQSGLYSSPDQSPAC